jgi:hypothetical protein
VEASREESAERDHQIKQILSSREVEEREQVIAD